MSEPVVAPWPPSPITPPEPDVAAVEAETPPPPAQMTPSDWLALIVVGMVGLLLWATAAFALATTLVRWSDSATFERCVDHALSVSAHPARCLIYPPER